MGTDSVDRPPDELTIVPSHDPAEGARAGEGAQESRSGPTFTGPHDLHRPNARPRWRVVAILILLVLVVVIIIAAVDLVVPGSPQIFLIQYDTPVSGCSGSTGHYVYSFKFALMNEGGPAFVTVRAYLDGAPALINGQNESMQYYVPGPHGAAYGDFFISAADCGMHAPTIAVTSVVPT